MAHVTDIQTLIDRQTAMDAEAGALVDEIKLAHPSHHDLSPRPQKLIDPVDKGVCADCGDPEYAVRDAKTGKTELRCRSCINGIMLQSLGHSQYAGSEICYVCKINYDSLGLVNSVTHRTWPINDSIDPVDDSVKPGLNQLLLDGRVNLNGDDVVEIG